MRRPDPVPLKPPLFALLAMALGAALLLLACRQTMIALQSPSATSSEAIHVL